ncbi:NERD domain-containing protein [Lysinibacillus parviboronicapiens]|uniref:NERD domain-containing protein n=1 Tax=Lysinibacillus parviboronicapiens TaxID=436516 RepID=UPI000D38DEA7|nr:NERD domain-containing protein [Lysinibacillus parviboronicapiens]
MIKRNFFERITFTLKDTEKLKKPIVVKQASDIKLRDLQNKLYATKDDRIQHNISKDIQLWQLGAKGENNVLFELKNSYLPLHILHDIKIASEENKAQLDFVVLTRKFILVIEVKNYYGNIKINDKDEFIRKVYRNKHLQFEEGFYSPIRQVQRQAIILENVLKQHEIINKTPIKHVVVFTNPKTILDMKEASTEVRQIVLRADQLVSYITKELKQKSPVHFLDNKMQEISNGILSHHQEKTFLHKDDTIDHKLLEETLETDIKDVQAPVRTLNHSELEEALRSYRKQQANKANLKAFHIFSNQTLEQLLQHRPITLAELKAIHGIGDNKVNAFGEELISIIQRYSCR